MNKLLPLVSVVITTKNEEKNIESCLISIQEQSYQNIEIIVVDNNSSDRTKELAKGYTKNIYNKGPERSAQRNYGMIEKSSGQYVMFIDADMILAPFLIDGCVHHMSSSSDVALHIPEIILGTSFLSKVRRFERSFYDGTVIDGARFFEKERFVEVGGFDESMSGPEDWDIDKKIKKIGEIGLIKVKLESLKNWSLRDFINGKGVFADKFSNSIFHNEADFILKDYLNKKKYYSKSFNIYVEKWGKNDKDIKKQFGLWYRYFGVFIERGRFVKLFSHPFLSIGMYFLRFMVGVKFLMRNV
jgi:glycosyltransferase involved in cell wall biosynthesis